MPGSALVQQQTHPFPHGQAGTSLSLNRIIPSPLGLNPYAEEYAPAPSPAISPGAATEGSNAFGSIGLKTFGPSAAQKSLSETRNLLIVDPDPSASQEMWQPRLERYSIGLGSRPDNSASSTAQQIIISEKPPMSHLLLSMNSSSLQSLQSSRELPRQISAITVFKYGELRHFELERSHMPAVTMILACFFNINDSTSCFEDFRKLGHITINYAIPGDGLNMDNQGTLVVFNVDERTTVEDMTDLFKTFGNVKDVRSSSKKGHRFVEFYDVRHAEKAYSSSSKKALELLGRHLNVEYSRPKPQSITPHSGLPMTTFTAGPTPEYMYPDSTMLMHPMSSPFSNALPGPPMYMSPVAAQYVPQPMNRRSEGGYRSPRSPRAGGGEKSESADSSKNKKNNFTFSEEEALSKTARTTLMIKNIPNKYSQKMMLDLLNKDFADTFDFFYLPIDFKNNCNLGYAFVNFKKPEDSLRFYRKYHTNRWVQFNSKKVCEVTYARVQGKPALVEHFKNARYPVHIAGDCQPIM